MATNVAMLSNAKALNWTYGPDCTSLTTHYHANVTEGKWHDDCSHPFGTDATSGVAQILAECTVVKFYGLLRRRSTS